MERSSSYIIHFDYGIVEDAITFQLQARVTVMPDNVYLIDDIRLEGQGSGSLIPPVSLRRYKGSWVYADAGKETVLSLGIGKAIDDHERLSVN